MEKNEKKSKIRNASIEGPMRIDYRQIVPAFLLFVFLTKKTQLVEFGSYSGECMGFRTNMCVMEEK